MPPGLIDENHILTVGEKAGFAKDGGILLLTFEDDHLAFVVNIDASRKAGIEISANLLRLATMVIEE